ncbi:paralemmin-1 isoform X3 [Varanus komodoensis]|uniref:paralemmin-1 isoform X3 n=1 Tax=Varanus komodoensis TaxID=61221 RepID=UPI001CF780F2|nr:paralemmin-1 isoform X3 [Varanus komodoensis]
METIKTCKIQQERIQVIAEKRRREDEIENKRHELDHDRRQLQHLKSKTLRERWLMEGAPSTDEEGEAMKKQMEEENLKVKELEEVIERLEKEIGELENGTSESSNKENSETSEEEFDEEKFIYLPTLPMGAAKVVHALQAEDGATESDIQQLSSSEVDELIQRADEVTMSEGSEKAKLLDEATAISSSGKAPPPKEITGVKAKPIEKPKILISEDGQEPSQDQPVTMIFMGYQDVEDENETKRALGVEGTVKAERVVINEEEEDPPLPDYMGMDLFIPPNGNVLQLMDVMKPGDQLSQHLTSPRYVSPKRSKRRVKRKKQRCKCCSVM